MHYIGDRYRNIHLTLHKRLLILFLFCVGLFLMFFFKTVQVAQHGAAVKDVQIMYEFCQDKLKSLQANFEDLQSSTYKPVRDKHLPLNIQFQLNRMNDKEHLAFGLALCSFGVSTFRDYISECIRQIYKQFRQQAGQSTKAATGFKYIKSLDSSKFIFPHLKKGSDGLTPAYHMTSDLHSVDIVIGVNTVRRARASYLNRTLQDLMEAVVDDTTTILIIVMIGETDLSYVLETASLIEKEFHRQVMSGMIQIISPSTAYYPNMNEIPSTLGDSPLRTRWRAKQVLDRVFLMAYGQDKGSYYLMMEDDVVAKKTYIKGVKSYISLCNQKIPEWLVIEFSHYFGSLGKLFRSSDIDHFSMYLQLFYYNMPLDFLIEKYLENKACGRMKTSDCHREVSKIRIKHPVSLFLHVGLYSSLTGKYMKVEESSAVVGHTFFPHRNPPLRRILCDIRELPFHTAKMAYNGEYIFVGVYPEPGDVIEFWLKKPTALKSYLFQTGNFQNPKDLLKHAVVEVLHAGGFRDNFTVAGTFDEFGFAKGSLDQFGLLEAVRLRVLEYGTKETGKIVISEIELVPMDAKDFN